MKWILLAVAILLNAGANVLMKAAVRSLGTVELSLGGLLRALLNPYLILGVLSFGLALGAYSYTLSKFPLSVAYPIMTSVGLIVVAGASVFLFQESFTPGKVAGSLLILGGVLLLARSL